MQMNISNNMTQRNIAPNQNLRSKQLAPKNNLAFTSISLDHLVVHNQCVKNPNSVPKKVLEALKKLASMCITSEKGQQNVEVLKEQVSITNKFYKLIKAAEISGAELSLVKYEGNSYFPTKGYIGFEIHIPGTENKGKNHLKGCTRLADPTDRQWHASYEECKESYSNFKNSIYPKAMKLLNDLKPEKVKEIIAKEKQVKLNKLIAEETAKKESEKLEAELKILNTKMDLIEEQILSKF